MRNAYKICIKFNQSEKYCNITKHTFVYLGLYHGLDDQVKEDETGRARSTNGEKRNAYMILVGKSEGKRPLG
jgi:hypothetical protein